MRIRTILAIAFGGIVALILARSVWSQQRLAAAIERYDALASEHDAAEDAVGRVQQIAIDMETAVRGYELTRQASFLGPYEDASRDIEPALTTLVSAATWSDAGRSHAEGAAQLLRAWVSEVARPLAAGDFGGDRVAAHLRWRAQMDAIRAELAALDEELSTTRAVESATFRALEEDTRNESILVALLMVLGVGLVALLSIRTIDRALLGLVRYAEGAGRGTHTAAPRSSLVEIDGLARSLDGLSERVTSREARDAALGALDGRLAESRGLDRVADVGLELIVERTGALAGCLLGEGDGARSTLAVRGVDRAQLGASDALATEVARSGKRREMALEDRSVVVRSALADVSPRRVLALPVAASGGGVVAVAELFDPAHEPDEVVTQALARLGLALEVAVADAAAEQMRAEVHASNQELSAQNEELRSQEEELRSQGEALRASQAELSQRNIDLERATRAKSDFLSKMSHELRTPLNAVMGFSDLLLEQAGSRMSAEERQFVVDIHDAGEELLRLVNDVLDLARVEAGALTVASRPMDLVQAAREAATMTSPLARGRGIEVDLKGLPASLDATGDAGRVRQVVVNLLSNALKLSPAGTVVRIEGGPAGPGKVRLAVIDQGPGISSADQARLFVPFSQLAHGRAAAGGAGLGLSIVKQLVTQMRGAVGVESEAGKGATFWFELPAGDGTVEPVAAPAPRRGRALVVEDLANEARSIEELLGRAGFDVTVASSAEAALAVMSGCVTAAQAGPHTVSSARCPVLIVVDLGLPGMPGQELISEIARRPELRSVTTVALTGRTLDEDERKALLSAGASLVAEKGVMTGPGFVGSLVALVEQRSSAPQPLRRVLVVDDVEVNQRVLLEMLPRARFEVVTVGDATSALDACAREPFDVVLMDVQLPDIDGLEATRRLHARPATAALPVIAVTAQAMAGDRERALAAGCIGYLAKPVGRAELLASIENALRAAEARPATPA